MVALFKLISIRILIYSLSTLACLTLTVLYIVFLAHGWNSFLVDQRAIVLIQVLIYGVSSIMLYLMMVLRFRPWDGVRIAFLVVFQAGGTAVFFVSRYPLPCTHIDPEFTCKRMENTVIIVGWLFAGILLLYALSLAIMSFRPIPSPTPDPEAALSPAKEERLSTMSDNSDYSQSLYTIPATRSPGAIDRDQSPNYYQTGSPVSVHSIVPSIHHAKSVSSIDGRPQKEPVLMQGTPLSVVTESIYDQQHPRSLTPSGVRGWNPSQPLSYHPSMAARLSIRSVSSISRSPSPHDLSLSFSAPMPAAPIAALLPTQTDLPMNTSHGRRGVHEVHRYRDGSV